MRILGISSVGRNAAAAYIEDGAVVAAVRQESLSRVPNDGAFPSAAADACLLIAGVTAAGVDIVACDHKPFDVLNRHWSTLLRAGPRSAAMLSRATPALIRSEGGLGIRLARWFDDRGAKLPPVHYVPQRASQGAAAFFPSPFRQAAVLVVDLTAEWSTTLAGFGHGSRLSFERELRFPDSVGLLHQAFAAYCGLEASTDSGELMALASFGRPLLADRILDRVVALREDGSITIDQRYFTQLGSRVLTTRRFHRLFGGTPRPAKSAPTEREADLAASVQLVIERIVMAMARRAHDDTGASQLCMSGSLALNGLDVTALVADGPFDEVWVQPASDEAGGAVGSALWASHMAFGQQRRVDADDAKRSSLLGPSHSSSEIRRWLNEQGIGFALADEADRRYGMIAERLIDGALIGWFVGRMPFGRQWAGGRSIFGDPRSPTVRSRLREALGQPVVDRPFTVAVLSEQASDWVEQSAAGGGAESGQIQVIDRQNDPELHRLIMAFERVSGCPAVIGTSFKMINEPIVCTPNDAYATFVRSGLDVLVLEDVVIRASGREGSFGQSLRR